VIGNRVEITIVTAVLNSKYFIEDCIQSIHRQTFKSIEHIVIDGGSTDGTLETIKKYQAGIAEFVSERDDGIYDAMNKGIRLATGEVIGILNADDFYPSRDILNEVAQIFENRDVESCYGDSEYVSAVDTGKVIRYWRSGSYDVNKFYSGWMPPHPTFFVRRSVYQKYGLFNLNLGSAADYELMLRFLVKHRITAAYIPKVIVKMRTGGVSNASMGNRIRANRMDRKAWSVNGLRPYPWTLLCKPLRKVHQFIVR
jgi:glycosyltransferase involved in cell wall biosynthesis